MNEQHDRQTVLVVDDTPENIDVLGSILSNEYRIKVAVDGETALKIAISPSKPDLILLDIMMPGIDGYEVCRQLKANAETQKIPIIFVTTKGEVDDETLGFQLGGADYITKPVSPPIVRERVRTHLALYDQNRVLEKKVRERTAQLRTASLDTIYRLSKAAEYRDEDTGSHVLRMSNYSVAIAESMGMDDDFKELLLYAAPMHDVGKIGIPDKILLKPGKLSDDEWEIMRRHCEYGAKILEGSERDSLKLGETIARTHHERWDGTGYPEGLCESDIPISGRIVALADVYDALTTKRPYKTPFSEEVASKIIRESRGSHFDPTVVDAFFDAKAKIREIKIRMTDASISISPM